MSSCGVAVALASAKTKDPFESEGRLSGTDRVRCWSAAKIGKAHCEENAAKMGMDKPEPYLST